MEVRGNNRDYIFDTLTEAYTDGHTTNEERPIVRRIIRKMLVHINVDLSDVEAEVVCRLTATI